MSIPEGEPDRADPADGTVGPADGADRHGHAAEAARADAAESAVAVQPGTQPKHPRRVLLFAVIAVAVLIIDQITKAVAVANLTPGVSPKILGGVIYFSLFRNSGAAFSMATGMTWVLALVAIAVVIAIIRLSPRLRSVPWAVAMGLILGGALGNLTDRIFRSPGVLRGWVVDFISVFGPDAKYFPVFNLADSAITIGGVTLVITVLLGIDFDGTRTRRRSAAARSGAGSDHHQDSAGG